MSSRLRMLAPLAALAAPLLLAGCSGEDGAAVSGEPVARAEVSDHDSEESCWAIIDEVVYDLTEWLPRHPGGREAIAQLCGQDGTALFEGRHGDDLAAQNQLERFAIGPLAD